MRNSTISIILLSFNAGLLGQIPNLPTGPNSSTLSIQNYSETNFRSNSAAKNTVAIPSSTNSTRKSEIERRNWEMQQNDFKVVEKEAREKEQKGLEKRVNTLEVSGYNLPSLSDRSGTNFYYDALSQLDNLDQSNYSLAEANFIVENAYSERKLTYSNFKANISKIASQVLQKMKSEKLTTDDNTLKNIALFKHFSKNYKYDFDDFMGKKEWNKMFVSKLLKTGKGQCHSMPLLYLMVAESIGADASLAMAPNHTYIRFKDDDNQWQNIELTNGILSTNAMILESGYIGSEALLNDVYMNSLDKKQLMSLLYADLANGYIHKYGMDEFVGKALDKSLDLYPNNMYANLLKSMYQQARFEYVAAELGIQNVENPVELENIKYFPKADQLLKETKIQFNNIDQLGFKFMPDGAYSEWLSNMNREANKQKSEELAEKIRLITLEKQRKIREENQRKLEEEKRKAREKKREEEKREEEKNKPKPLLT
ncbi:transglutaminase family protein [Chryseobacterium aquaticum]|uniref:Protein SirB1 N-terminal domain-containing protein n=1 Tax=Chryseobacterium aquaticum subsp. greenlandense TaxID=345663 RepID=A0A117KBS4_9FLAO|nr:transglutaminase family protein [Chryseobacterium aquaticum]KUJ56381.1 hypothetical protein AR686_07405 [Chryseobacterium aquaticum subsp. greenlandense]